MKLFTLLRNSTFVIVLGCAPQDAPQDAPRDTGRTVSSPTLANRAEIIQARDSMGALLLQPGEQVSVKVFVVIDAQGIAHQPEIKPEPEDQRVGEAALALVSRMQFNPAVENGQPRPVMMTIPVVFKRGPS